MFSWFPGTRAHRFLYVREGWIKVKAEHRGTRGSHLLPPRPSWFVLMFIRGVAQLCRRSFKIQVRIQKFFEKKRERKKPTTTARGDLAYLLASRGCTAAEEQSSGQCGSCSSTGMSWRVGGNQCKSNPTQAPSCSACPFSQSTVLVSFITSSSFAAGTQLALCKLPGQLIPCHMLPISPLSAGGAAWSPAPSRRFSPLYIEKFWEREAPLQLLQFAENPRPLGLSFSWMRAFQRPWLNFKKQR